MKNKKSPLHTAILIGSTISSSLLVCGGVGYFFYYQYQNLNYLLIGLIVGAILGMYEMYKFIKWYN